jgi:organic radical activating enzyme
MILSTKNTAFEKYNTLAEYVLDTKEDIVIYGCGSTAKMIIPIFQKLGFNIKTILDKNSNLHGFWKCIPVIHPDEYKENDSIFVICATNTTFSSINEYLRHRGIKRILPFFFFLFNKEIDMSGENAGYALDFYSLNWLLTRPKYHVLDSIDIPITMKCSLKCRDCANLMQYFTHPKNVDFETMRIASERLLSLLDHCFEIRILGGEPFMNKELYRYIEIFDNFSSKYEWIVIYTNSTIIPNNINIAALKNKKIIVKMSDYGNSRQKINEISKIFRDSGVYYFVNNVTQWQPSGILRDYDRSKTENSNILRECCVNNVPSLVDGKLFRCPYAGNLFTLSGIPFSCHEYVDLLNTNINDDDLKNEIHNIMTKVFLKACNYCGGRPSTGASLPPAVQIDKPLDYIYYADTGLVQQLG